MLNYGKKIDNDETSAGVVTAKEYNSLMEESKSAVIPYLNLDELDNKQTAKAIDIASKAMFYADIGTVNAVALTRGATTETLETLFDGMVVIFAPANANTGATTIKIKTLETKRLKNNGKDLVAGYLDTQSKYIAVYSAAYDRFDIDVITGGSASQKFKVANADNDNEAINRGQANSSYLGKTDKAVDSDKLDGLNSTDFSRVASTETSNGSIGVDLVDNWVTVASTKGGRHNGRVIVSDKTSGRHGFVEICWIRSYSDSSFTVLNIGGHTRHINGVRILRDADNTYGYKLLQVRTNRNATLTVQVVSDHNNSGWTQPVSVIPIVENTKQGFTVFKEVTNLANSSFATSRGVMIGENSYIKDKLILTDEAHSFSTNGNGYQRLNNGLMIQWHHISIKGNTNQEITWPVAFPNNCFSCVTTFSSEFKDSNSYLGVYNLRKDKYNIANGQSIRINIRVWGIGN